MGRFQQNGKEMPKKDPHRLKYEKWGGTGKLLDGGRALCEKKI